MYGPKGKAAVLLNNGIKQKYGYLLWFNSAAIISILLSTIMIAVTLINLVMRSIVLRNFPVFYTGSKICCVVCILWCILANWLVWYLSYGYKILYKMLYLYYQDGCGMYLNLLTQKDRREVEKFLHKLNSPAIHVCGDELRINEDVLSDMIVQDIVGGCTYYCPVTDSDKLDAWYYYPKCKRWETVLEELGVKLEERLPKAITELSNGLLRDCRLCRDLKKLQMSGQECPESLFKYLDIIVQASSKISPTSSMEAKDALFLAEDKTADYVESILTDSNNAATESAVNELRALITVYGMNGVA